MDIIYCFEKGSGLWVCFRYAGRVYSRPCKWQAGSWLFRFKGEQHSVTAQRIY